MEYPDLGRREYVNRRLRIKGRFVSREKACQILFGPGGEQNVSKYSFEQLKTLINEKFNNKKED